ncbi:hypothetical protein VE00_09192 [Pseudogymnoascus sp. WSF 3629]|nr:hypothetical protein VE00_09192 [Pseudogymnoascus sp. WSF 3629]
MVRIRQVAGWQAAVWLIQGMAKEDRTVNSAVELYDYDIIITNFEAVTKQYSNLQQMPRPRASLFSQIHEERGRQM